MSPAPPNVQPEDEPIERQEAVLFSCGDCDVESVKFDEETPDTCFNCGSFNVFISDSYEKG